MNVFPHSTHSMQLSHGRRDISQLPEQAKVFPHGTCCSQFPDTPKKRTVILTFDDACKSHFSNVAPILKKYGFDATFFICRFNDQWRAKNESSLMTIKEIRQLADMGFDIGNHTWNHPDLRKCSDDECETESQRLNDFLAEGGIEQPVSFAYPGGPFAENAVPILKRMGIKFARTTEQKTLDSKTNLLRIPAIPLQKDDELAFYNAVFRCSDTDAVVLVFHGVPDIVHNFVSTSVSFFEKCMKYLYNNDYRVISIRRHFEK